MIRFLADENFNGHIVRGLLRKLADVDLIRAQDIGMSGSSDPELLAAAAEQDRVVLSHDVHTLVAFAYERVSAGLPMPGVIEASRQLAIGAVIDDLELIATCGESDDFLNQVVYLPL